MSVSCNLLFDSSKPLYRNLPYPQGAYLVSHLFNAVSFGTVMIAPISGALPSGEGLIEGLKKASADIAFIVPSIVQDLAQDPTLLEYCAEKLEAIIYCGGDLPQAIGDIVASRIRLVNQFGASELGLTPNLLSQTNRSPEDWKYVEFHPKLGLELRHTMDGMHELYAVRNPKLKELQPTFTIFPETQEYASRDLFVRHPSREKHNLWRWQARADDVIVFLHGEKTNPNSMEQHIVARNPDVSAALVIGAQRFQAALLVEPVTSGRELSLAEQAAFIERIWPTVEEANADAPSHAQIMKSHVLLTKPQKPMLRAGKGTMQRSGTLKSYAVEIDKLYKDADTMSEDFSGIGAAATGNFDKDLVSKTVRHFILENANWKSLDNSDNFFALGMDSLQALVLVRKLKQALRVPDIALSTIYTNPSVDSLSGAILHLSDKTKASKISREQKRVEERKAFVEEYKEKIDRIKYQSETRVEHDKEVVILTGSTGALGSYILDYLLRDPAVARVICLNRAQDSLSLHIKRNETRGLPDPRTLGKELSFFTADFAQEHLGLSTQVLETLVADTTLIIHNAWPVNFNLPLHSFRPQLDSLLNLLKMMSHSQRSPQLFFISSISSVMSYKSSSSMTPETIITADTAPGPNGYAESKSVAESLLDYASQKHGFLCSVARVGQIAGSVHHAGIWNPDEWFPSMIITSAHISAIPDSLGPVFDTIDWIPMDLLPYVLFELALEQQQQHSRKTSDKFAQFFHPVNPNAVSWEELRDTVTNELQSHTKTPINIIPLHTWITKVRKAIESAVAGDHADLEPVLRAIPAAKLLDFYDALLTTSGVSNRLETTNTMNTSPKLREMDRIKESWMRKWFREWMTTQKKVN